MPYEVRKVGNKHCVFKKGTNKKLGCHDSPAGAQRQIAAIHANTQEALFTSGILRRVFRLTFGKYNVQPWYTPRLKIGSYGPLRRLVIRHGTHSGQSGRPGQAGGSQPGYTHEPGSAASQIADRLSQSGYDKATIVDRMKVVGGKMKPWSGFISREGKLYSIDGSIKHEKLAAVGLDEEPGLIMDYYGPMDDEGFVRVGSSAGDEVFVNASKLEDGHLSVIQTMVDVARGHDFEFSLDLSGHREYGNKAYAILFRLGIEKTIEERHGQHSGQTGRSGQAGGSQPGFTHGPGGGGILRAVEFQDRITELGRQLKLKRGQTNSDRVMERQTESTNLKEGQALKRMVQRAIEGRGNVVRRIFRVH